MASVHKRETSRGVRYDVRYRDPAGRPRVKTWRRRADAERFARQVEADKDRGLFLDPKLARTPLAEVAKAWLDSNPGKRDGSWQRDEIAVRRHIVPALGDRPVGGLTPGDVQAAVNRWARERAPRTVRREYGVLRAILNYAVANDLIGRTPCRGIKLPEVTRSERHIVDADELARLADALGGVGHLGPMVYLGTVDGLRWGEVAGLRVRQLDFTARTVAVVETVVRGRRGAVGFGAPKSAAGRRTLAVPVELMDMLAEHMAKKGLTKADRDALLFTAPDGGVLRYSNWLRRSWWPACVAAGLGRMVRDEATGKERYEGLGFHDLRRANATGLVAAGVDVKTAQGLLGHSDARLTLDHYAQVVTELGEAAAKAMGERFLRPRDGRAMERVEGQQDG
ncbi:MAG TPA: tyrosine-type recombinase/integrase [Acidimicrobiales bacterium]